MSDGIKIKATITGDSLTYVVANGAAVAELLGAEVTTMSGTGLLIEVEADFATFDALHDHLAESFPADET